MVFTSSELKALEAVLSLAKDRAQWFPQYAPDIAEVEAMLEDADLG